MKVVASETLLAIFAVLLGIVLATLLAPKVMEPSVEFRSNENAYLIAQRIASTVNALNVVGKAEAELELKYQVDVEIREDDGKHYVQVSGDGFESKEIGKVLVLGNIRKGKIENVMSLSFERGEDGKVKVSRA